MARTDTYLDAMLRHLGAAYYESLHGRATRSDVTRALDTVEEHLKEPAASPAAGVPAQSRPAHPAGAKQHRRWARRVRDVMTTSVVTVDRITPYQEIERLLFERRARPGRQRRGSRGGGSRRSRSARSLPLAGEPLR